MYPFFLYMAVYILHFEKKFYHTQHYIGWTKGNSIEAVQKRLKTHLSGKGSKIVRSVVASGIKIEVATIFINGDRKLERKLKDKKNAKQFCSICNDFLIVYGVKT